MTDKTIEVAYNSKTGTYGTLIGPPPGPHVIPFSALSKEQRKIMMGRLYPVTSVQMGFVRLCPETICNNLLRYYEGVISGAVKLNPVYMDDIITVVKVLYYEWRKKQPEPKPEEWK